MEGDGGCTKWGKDCALGSSSIQGLGDEGELAEETERVARGQGEKPNKRWGVLSKPFLNELELGVIKVNHRN